MKRIKEFAFVNIAKRKQFILYSFIGVSGALLDLLIFTILFNAFGFDKNIAKIISVTFGITNTFVLNLLFNFKVKDNIFLRFISYYSIGIFGLLVALGMFIIFVDILKFNTNIINLVSIPIIVILQYNLNRLISFKSKN